MAILHVSMAGTATSETGMSKRMSYGKIYRPDVHGCRSDVHPRPHLSRGRGFTYGRVFTVHADSKNSVRASIRAWVPAGPGPHERVVSAHPRVPASVH
jgi:hypothetical protein